MRNRKKAETTEKKKKKASIQFKELAKEQTGQVQNDSKNRETPRGKKKGDAKDQINP